MTYIYNASLFLLCSTVCLMQDVTYHYSVFRIFFYVLIWYWEYYWCCCVFLQLFICDTKWHAGVMHYRP